MLTYQFGDILLAAGILDPQGRNPKNRPVVITELFVGPDLELEIEVIAITTLIPDPLPTSHVLLPWQQPRHPRTGLNKRAAVVVNWMTRITPDRVLDLLGFVPGRQRIAIAELLTKNI